VNVIWDLAPHDFSIMLHIVKERPAAVSVVGKNHINHVVNMAYITMYFSSSVIAHFNVNWLSPLKIRNTLICGEKKMLVWNDIVQDDKIKIYDKGVEVRETRDIHHLRVSYRSGDMWAPKLDHSEALAIECKHFVDSILSNGVSGNDGRMGLEVVKLLAAADESLAQNGKEVSLRN
jgi:predicted dehydrogenase